MRQWVIVFLHNHGDAIPLSLPHSFQILSLQDRWRREAVGMPLSWLKRSFLPASLDELLYEILAMLCFLIHVFCYINTIQEQRVKIYDGKMSLWFVYVAFIRTEQNMFHPKKKDGYTSPKTQWILTLLIIINTSHYCCRYAEGGKMHLRCK